MKIRSKIIIDLNISVEESDAAETTIINTFDYAVKGELTNIVEGNYSSETFSV